MIARLAHVRWTVCCNSALSFQEDTIRGLIHIGCSLEPGHAIHELRRSWIDANKPPRTRLYRGYPTAQNDDYIKACLRWFIPGNKNSLLRSSLFLSLSRGSWSNTDHIELIVPPDQHIPDEFQYIMSCLMQYSRLLFPRRPRKYDRHNWVGKKEPVCDVGLPESFHGSFSRGYQELCRRLDPKSKPTTGLAVRKRFALC